MFKILNKAVATTERRDSGAINRTVRGLLRMLLTMCIGASDARAQPACSNFFMGFPSNFQFFAGFPGGQNSVRWYCFALPHQVDASAYLDIFTGPSSSGPPVMPADTAIALYDGAGNLIASNDNDGPDNFSALTFGCSLAPRAYAPNGFAFNGRNGLTLNPGQYYLAIATSPATFGPNWNVTSGPHSAGSVDLFIYHQPCTPALLSPTNPVEMSAVHPFDSGPLRNDGAEFATVLNTVIVTPGAAWTRLYLGQVALPAPGFLRFTSLADGEVQVLDSYAVSRWGNSSAYFNGDSIRVELIAAPHSAGNVFRLENVGFQPALQTGPCSELPCGTCAPDERFPTNYDWSGRYFPAGCSGTVYNDMDCAVTAGHCFTVTNSSILMFRVPLSSPGCAVQVSAVADQFTIIAEIASNNGPGNDWRVMKLGPNSNGVTHFQRYGVAGIMPIAAPNALPLQTGDAVNWYGFGNANPPAVNSIQQESSGHITSVFADSYNSDGTNTGGCSGSALIHNNAIAGIITHCAGACTAIQTRIDLPAFVQARSTLCPPSHCTLPPHGMSGWWPGDNTTDDIAGGFNGTLHGTATYTASGKVGSAFSFPAATDYVSIVHGGALDPGAGDFTFDAWVYNNGSGQIANWPSAAFGNNPGACNVSLDILVPNQGPTPLILRVQLRDTLGNQVDSPSFLGNFPGVYGQWSHIAFTLNRQAGTLTTYVNGLQSAQCALPSGFGPLISNGPLQFGDRAGTGFHNPVPRVDEVEVFGRALSVSEIASIFNAGAYGKCKHGCHVQWDSGFCIGETQITVPITVCNYDHAPHPFLLNFAGLTGTGTGTPCHVNGPTSFQVVGPNPVMVPGRTCQTIQVQIGRPPGLSPGGTTACYDVTMINLDDEQGVTCHGAVQNTGELCPLGPPTGCCPPFTVAAVGAAARGSFEVRNDGVFGGIIDFRVEARGADMALNAGIAFNALPGGVPLSGSVNAPVGGTALIEFDMTFLRHEPFVFSNIVLLADPERDGSFYAIASFGAMSEPAPFARCPVAIDDSCEIYPSGPVCGIGGWEEWVGSVDVCGSATTERAFGGNRSLKIVGNVGGSTGLGDDTVHRFSGVTSGRWTFKTMTFVPNDATGIGYLNLLSTYDDPPGSPAADYRWSLQVRFDANLNQVIADINVGATPLAKGRWVEFRVEIDLDSDLADYFYDGVRFVQNRSWSCGIGAPFCGTVARIQALDLYGGEPSTNGTSGMYFDDISLLEICPPAQPPCLADFNGDGKANSQDYFDFIACFFTPGCSNADFNANGFVNSQDFFDFLAAFFTGCP